MSGKMGRYDPYLALGFLPRGDLGAVGVAGVPVVRSAAGVAGEVGAGADVLGALGDLGEVRFPSRAVKKAWMDSHRRYSGITTQAPLGMIRYSHL